MKRPLAFTGWLLYAGLLLLPQAYQARTPGSASDHHWVSTWVSMPQLTETGNLPPAPFTGDTAVFVDSTLRQTIHTSIGGRKIRLRFSNAFGDTAITLDAVRLALPAGGVAGASAIDPATEKAVTFQGSESVTIPAGAQVVSDTLTFRVAPRSNLAVTLYTKLGQPSKNVTSHPGSRTTSFMVPGNHVSDADLAGVTGVASVNHWYFLSALELWAEPTEAAVAIIGDSLTDGRGSTTNGNDRWPDQLSDLLQASPSTQGIAIMNQAAGGNRVLNDGLGPNVLARLDRDLLVPSGVRWAIVFEGINDIGTGDATAEAQQKIADQLIRAYQQIIIRAHERGISVYGATLTPFGGSFYVDATGFRETTRRTVNKWIRTSGQFDAVIDFERAVQDPTDPTVLAAAYDSGDHLHLTPAGYKALAAAVHPGLFWQRWHPGATWRFGDEPGTH